MEILATQSSRKGPVERFTGDAWFDQIAGGGGTSRVRAAIVHFAPGARNAWHAHVLGQTLHVTEGVGRTQVRGGDVVEIQAGDTIAAAPGEWHWHGAAPDRFMTHLTVYEAPETGPETEWGEHVSDAEYLAPPSPR
jgi:quercetin dioxygenase-like cupin family protein